MHLQFHLKQQLPDYSSKLLPTYHYRVASLSEKRVKQDQSKVEDTLSLNRQSKVEEDFANFFDDARMDAREKIQTFFSLREKIDVDDIYYPRLACLIFEVRLAIPNTKTCFLTCGLHSNL